MSTLLDRTLFRSADDAVDFIGNVLEASTEYSIIGTDLEGRILLWNQGARRLYGYEPDEVISASKTILHVPEDVEAGIPAEMMRAALSDGKWEGTLERVRKDRSAFTARVVVTPRWDASRTATGFLLITKDISDEARPTHELQETRSYTRSLSESDIDALMTTALRSEITPGSRS